MMAYLKSKPLARQWYRRIKTLALRISKGKSLDFQFEGKQLFRYHNSQLVGMDHFADQQTDAHHELASFMRYAAGHQQFVDIGALYGVFSFTFCAINHGAAAYAIDPSKWSACQIRRNMQLNPQLQVRFQQTALGNQQGSLAMAKERDHYVAVAPSMQAEQQPYQAQVTTLDQWIAQQAITPTILKIDVEGFEWQVIQGGQNFLRRQRPVIFLEIHPHRLQQHGHSVTDIAGWLAANGYCTLNHADQPVNLFDEIFHHRDSRVICIPANA